MGDEEHRHLPFQAVDGQREMLGGLLVEAGDGLVEDEDLRALEQRTGDGEALALAAGEADAVFADLGLVALRQLLDDVVDLGEPGRP